MGKTTHGQSPASGFTPEYRAYYAMRNRVLNPNQERFEDYGGRGIKICSRWIDGEDGKCGFECFYHDLGPKPSAAHSLERKDNDGDYEPLNVKWATAKEQNRNSRNVRLVDVCGFDAPLVEVVERYGAVNYNAVVTRIHRGLER